MSATTVTVNSFLSSLQSSLQSEIDATKYTTSSTEELNADVTASASSTSSATPTRNAGVYASGTYNLTLSSSELEYYGNPSNASKNAFLCVESECQVTVINHGYSELWWAIMNTTDYYASTPHASVPGLLNGTNSYSLHAIAEDDMNLRNQSIQYTWALYDSENSSHPIGMSGPFQMFVNEWNYTAGLPQAAAFSAAASDANPSFPTSSPNNSNSQSGATKPGLSTGAIAGIVIGVICLFVIAVFLIRWRRRKTKVAKIPHGVYEKGVDNPLNKPELVGTTPGTSGVPYNKPELTAVSELLPSGLSSPQGTSKSPRHELAAGSSQGTRTNLNYEDDAIALSESEYRQDKQVLESERLIPDYMEVSNPQVGASSSLSQNVRAGAVTTKPTLHEDVNVLKAQEREMSHQMEISDELQRMRAEHAALIDRIRIAEMRERQARGGLGTD